MKKIIAFCALVAIVSCRAFKPDDVKPDQQIQCTLIGYKQTSLSSVEITALTANSDTLFLLYGWRGLGKKKFSPGLRLTVMYNSNHYQVANGKRFYPSRIIINQ